MTIGNYGTKQFHSPRKHQFQNFIEINVKFLIFGKKKKNVEEIRKDVCAMTVKRGGCLWDDGERRKMFVEQLQQENV